MALGEYDRGVERREVELREGGPSTAFLWFQPFERRQDQAESGDAGEEPDTMLGKEGAELLKGALPWRDMHDLARPTVDDGAVDLMGSRCMWSWPGAAQAAGEGF